MSRSGPKFHPGDHVTVENKWSGTVRRGSQFGTSNPWEYDIDPDAGYGAYWASTNQTYNIPEDRLEAHFIHDKEFQVGDWVEVHETGRPMWRGAVTNPKATAHWQGGSSLISGKVTIVECDETFSWFPAKPLQDVWAEYVKKVNPDKQRHSFVPFRVNGVEQTRVEDDITIKIRGKFTLESVGDETVIRFKRGA
jgi:hypothetical protein